MKRINILFRFTNLILVVFLFSLCPLYVYAQGMKGVVKTLEVLNKPPRIYLSKFPRSISERKYLPSLPEAINNYTLLLRPAPLTESHIDRPFRNVYTSTKTANAGATMITGDIKAKSLFFLSLHMKIKGHKVRRL